MLKALILIADDDIVIYKPAALWILSLVFAMIRMYKKGVAFISELYVLISSLRTYIYQGLAYHDLEILHKPNIHVIDLVNPRPPGGCQGFTEKLFLSSCFIPSLITGRESGQPSKRKSYLPPEKQFLITRNGKPLDLSLSLPIVH